MPCSLLKVNRRLRETCCLHVRGRRIIRAKIQLESRWLCLPQVFTLVSCSAYSSTLKMDVTCFSETSVDFQRITQRYMLSSFGCSCGTNETFLTSCCAWRTRLCICLTRSTWMMFKCSWLDDGGNSTDSGKSFFGLLRTWSIFLLSVVCSFLGNTEEGS
jgi:hypothetical protein